MGMLRNTINIENEGKIVKYIESILDNVNIVLMSDYNKSISHYLTKMI